MQLIRIIFIINFLFCSPIFAGHSKSSTTINIDKINKASSYYNNPLKWSALNYAIAIGDYESAEIICDYTIDINKKDSAYLSDPKSADQINALERVLFIAQFVNKQSVLSKEQRNLVKKLREKGIEFDTDSNIGMGSPIFYLGYFNEIELVVQLLDNGVDINKANGRLLSEAFSRGHTKLVQYLLSLGADAGRINMLHDAILGQKLELVQLALDYGCDIPAFDAVNVAIDYTWDEIRSLDTASFHETPALKIVHFLLTHGANPNFWVAEAVSKNQDMQEAFTRSPLGKALNLLNDQPPSYKQKLYQQLLINILLQHGAGFHS